ncbi:MAG TPA: peptide deformylase [Candidatus Paceibacterota bacterium]|nr:peptide deformylase [Candidatus Paceibacterota bacterium]
MELTVLPDPILTHTSRALTPAELRDGRYAGLITKMRETMKTNNGVGLAANQVGEDIALFVIDEKLAEEYKAPSVYANPEISEYGKDIDTLEEGCLSIPGYWAPVRRAKKIMFKALDEHGDRIKFRARGMLARVLQHETDHLRGVTIRERSVKPATHQKKKTLRS